MRPKYSYRVQPHRCGYRDAYKKVSETLGPQDATERSTKKLERSFPRIDRITVYHSRVEGVDSPHISWHSTNHLHRKWKANLKKKNPLSLSNREKNRNCDSYA
jgi:hypothetical protein